jgi:hypothetical protein
MNLFWRRVAITPTTKWGTDEGRGHRRHELEHETRGHGTQPDDDADGQVSAERRFDTGALEALAQLLAFGQGILDHAVEDRDLAVRGRTFGADPLIVFRLRMAPGRRQLQTVLELLFLTAACEGEQDQHKGAENRQCQQHHRFGR